MEGFEGFDPISVTEEDAAMAAESASQAYNEFMEGKAERDAAKIQQQKNEEQLINEAKDPRNREGGGGFRGVVKEVQSAIGGGVQDTASSIVTLPERAIDMFSGEMVEESKTEEGYGAEWDDWFVNDANPIETKTWWGGAIRSLVHFGTMAAAIIPAAKAAGIAAGTTALGTLVRGAGIGAVSDLASKYSQEENGLQILRDRFNFIDTPLATNDSDHPAVKTLKNVVEGMGIGAVFDGFSIVLGKGIKKVRPGKKPGTTIIEDGTEDALNKSLAREQNVKDQIVERAKSEIDEDIATGNTKKKFSGYKNKPVADPWQGTATSNGTPYDVRRQLSRTRNEWGAEMGSTDSVTPVQLTRTAMTAGQAEEQVKGVLENFMSDARIQKEIADAKAAGKTLMDVWGEAAEKIQRIYEGRNTSDISPEEFWREFNLDKDIIDGREVWQSGNVVAADLIIGSLVRELRDQGIAGRELFDIANMADVDGPAKAMYEKLIAGLTQIKLAKMTKSASFRNLGAGVVRETVDGQVKESIDAFQLAFKLAGESQDDDLFKAIFETVSMSNDIHNITDFDAWVRKKLKGGEFNGKNTTGLLLREWQGVFINSVLSGPKTAVRAIMGTGTATFLRPLSQVLGATMSGDGATRRASMAAMHGMIEAIPEAWTLFKTKLNSYWSGDIANFKTRYLETTKGDQQWNLLGDWIENSGRATSGDKAAYYAANMARSMNDNRFLTYSTKIMQATDDTFGYILARSKAKEKAMRLAMDQANKGNVTEITPDLLRNAEDRFLSEIMDADGNITDGATLFAKKEATLTNDLTGFAKGMNDVFDKTPWAKPFFLFARTGANGLALTAKHTPGFNFLVKEFNDIAFANPNDLRSVLRYGIENIDDLRAAQALQKGRLAIGSGIVTMATTHFFNGGLTGNGPTDRQKRQAWIDAGYKPRSVKIGDVWISYDAFEPFNLILSTIADVGDHSQLMGEEWAEDQFQKVAVVMMQSITSKSYMAGLQQFTDLFAGKPGSHNRIIAGLLNNTMPLSSLRNELGKVFNPHMKELNSGVGDAIRNRNLLAEQLGTDPLPTKYDLLTGKPIRDWDFATRMFNMFSPVHFSLDYAPGRQLLFDSGYDMRMSTYSAPDGTDLSDSPRIRSKFMQAIGEQNLLGQLNKLVWSRKIMLSIAKMESDLAAGRKEIDPKSSYYHTAVIHRMFQKARQQAWLKIKNDPEILELIQEARRLERQKVNSLTSTTMSNNILGMYK